jgi:hypothetical protein
MEGECAATSSGSDDNGVVLVGHESPRDWFVGNS